MLISSTVIANHNTRNLETFNKLRVSESINVTLVNGNKNSANVHVNSGNIEDLITKVNDGVLKIYWKNGMGNNRSAKVTVNYTSLKSISTSAGAKVGSKEVLTSDDLKLSASSGGQIELEINCTNLNADVSSGSKIILDGVTKNQDIDASSGSAYKASSLISEMTKADASSGASIVVHVNNALSAEASSGASIKYKGNPGTKDFDANDISGGRILSLK